MTPAPSTTFYHEMPTMPHIKYITDLSYYRDVPNDWLIAISDVRNSTIAIQNGQYKSVNTCGAATIAAILNSIPDVDVPFVFGGDGATVVVPPHVRQQTADALCAVKSLANSMFDLDLRIGLVPVADVIPAGYDVKVGKVFMSDNFSQPVFTGGGLDYADELLKSPAGKDYIIEPHGGETADFSGFECRWSKHPASSEEVVSVLVKATNLNVDARNRLYEDTLDRIHDIYGEHEDRHPINQSKMTVAWKPGDYMYETGIRVPNRTWWDAIKLMLWSIGGYFLWKYKAKIWDKYKDTVYHSTDHEKFDDMLRMTISGTTQQREKLRNYLQWRRNAGDLVFGIHVAHHSLMTCIVFDRFGRQVHFIDADEGGYAQAAVELKTQLKQRKVATAEIPWLAS